MSSADSESNENLRVKLIAFEESLSDVLLAEYFKRSRFVESALEDYIKNFSDVEKLHQDRLKSYVNLHNLSIKFLYASLVFIVIIIAFDIDSMAVGVGYLLLSLIISKKYIDTKYDDEMQSECLVLCQMEIQRIKRDLSMYGVNSSDLIRFKVDRDLIEYREEVVKNKTEENILAQSQKMYSIKLRMAHRVYEGMLNKSDLC
jgi:hypothetical protein